MLLTYSMSLLIHKIVYIILNSIVANIGSARLFCCLSHPTKLASPPSDRNMRQMPLAMFRSGFMSYGVDEAALPPQRLEFLYGLPQWYQFPLRLRYLVITIANVNRARFFLLGSHH